MLNDAGADQQPRAGARKTLAVTRVELLRLGVDTGELIEAQAFEGAIAAAAGEYANILNRVDASVAMAFGLSAEAKAALRAWLDAERRAMIETLATRLRGGDD